MNSEIAKKRKRDVRDEGEGSGGCEMAVEEIMAEMKTQMMRLQSEVDGMKGRLHHVDELESKCRFLEGRCESLEKTVQIVINGWEYSRNLYQPLGQPRF